MKKILSLFALLFSTLVFGQSYPSPTFHAVTIQTPLAVSSGGTNSSSASGTAVDNISGFAGTGFLTRTGAGAYAFQSTTNGITLGNLAQAAGNTVLGNGTGPTANITALAMPNCSAATSALKWTSNTGPGCNTAIQAATLNGTTFAAPGPIGSTTASTGAFTTLSASSAISGTGFSTYLASPPAIGGTSAAAGSFTTLTASSTITPSTTSGIVGTTLGDNANAGSDGEVFTANSTGTSLTSGNNSNITSVTLTAGDFDCSGTVVFLNGGTSSVGSLIDGISTTSASLPNEFNNGRVVLPSAVYQASLPTPIVRENVTGSTQVFLVAQATWTTATITADGLIRCRRVR